MIGAENKPRRLTLPPEEALPRIDAITVNARSTWFALLGLLAFVGVTLLGVEDIDFFDASRRTQLPLVGVSVPTLTFFYVAPALTAAIYAYFHFYLMKLWDALAEAPAQVKGRRLGDLVHPWLVTDAALWFRRREGATGDRPLRLVSAFTAGALTWGFGWAVLGYAWWRSHTAHLEGMSLMLLALFVFALWVGASSLHAAWRRVGHGETRERHQGRWPSRAVLALAVPLAMVSWMRTEGGIEAALVAWSDLRAPEGEDSDAAYERRRALEAGPLSTRWLSTIALSVSPSWMFVRYRTSPAGLRHVAILAPIDLFQTRIVEKPEGWLDFTAAAVEFRIDWCKRRERPIAACGEPIEQRVGEEDEDTVKVRKHAQKTWCDSNGLSVDSCEGFFALDEISLLAAWKVRRSEYISTFNRLSFARRDLRGANLYRAFLPGLDLSFARVDGAVFGAARMEGALLWETRMEGTNLWEARMENAVLRGAHMEGTMLSGARMDGADLRAARMKGAILSGANLQGADLREVDARSADIRSWNNSRTNARGADFSGAEYNTRDHVRAMFGDRTTILPEGLRRTDLMDREPRENWWDPDPAYQAWLAAGAPPGKPLP